MMNNSQHTKKPLIDDEVRRNFPGRTDEEIERFYNNALEAAKDDRPTLLSTDLHLASIVRNCGWQALKEYLELTTGSADLDAEDIIAITQACAYWRTLDNAELYSALFGAASEATNKKTITARKKGIAKLLEPLDRYRLTEEV